MRFLVHVYGVLVQATSSCQAIARSASCVGLPALAYQPTDDAVPVPPSARTLVVCKHALCFMQHNPVSVLLALLQYIYPTPGIVHMKQHLHSNTHAECRLCTAVASVHCRILQLDDEDIKTAYRKLAMQLHPDRQLGKDARTRAQAAELFAQLLKAYDTLKDPEQRKLYDAGELVEATLSL